MPTPLPPFKTVPLGRPKDRFEAVLARVLKHEGGFNDTKGDRGGATNHGISLRFAMAESKADPVVRRLLDMDMDGDVDYQDIRRLSRDVAAAVYRRCFWDRYRCADLPAPLDAAVFDQAVNGGGVSAVKMLQEAVNITFGFPQIVIDGRMGPMTIKAAKVAGPAKVIVHYRLVAATRYRAIVRADPVQRKFLNGWLGRASVLGDV